MLSGILSALPGAAAQGILWGIMALGTFVTYKLLDYADLTVDSSLATGGAVTVILIYHGVHPLPALLGAVAAGMAAGAVTGFLNTKCGIPEILSGILTQLGLYSINIRILGKANLSLLGQPVALSLGRVWPAVGVGLAFAAVVIAALYWFFGTELGCAIRATGNNRKMVRAQGVNTNTMKIVALVLSNGLVGLAGGLLAQFQGYADVGMGRGAIVIGLASIIIGEVIFGNRFNFAWQLSSVIGGAILYYIIISLVLQMGLTTSDLKLLSALVVAVALSLPTVQKKLRRPKVELPDLTPTDDTAELVQEKEDTVHADAE